MYFIIIKKQTIQIFIELICICDILVGYFYIDIDYMEMYGVLFGWIPQWISIYFCQQMHSCNYKIYCST